MIAQKFNDTPVCCTRCGSSLTVSLRNASTALSCTSCGAQLEVELFPALFTGLDPVQVGDSLKAEDEASCYYHPSKRAVVPCAICGRFLCSLCDIPLAGQNLCPTCVESAKDKGRLAELVTQRTLYDQIALCVASIPMLFIWPTIITAPMALYISFRYWKSPMSLLPRTRIRSILAILIAGLQLTAWVVLLVYWTM